MNSYYPTGVGLIELNDEAISALFDPDLEGWVRVGLQEDFGEPAASPPFLILFAQAHPKVSHRGAHCPQQGIARKGCQRTA